MSGVDGIVSGVDGTHIYVIADTKSGTERLVRAVNKSRAAKASVTVRLASQSDLERLLEAGVIVEGKKPAGQAQQPRRRAR